MTQPNDSLIFRIRSRLLRRASYRKLFCDEKTGKLKPEAEVVIADLMRVSRYESTILVVNNGVTDIPGSFAAEGMRSIVGRIVQYCRFDDSDLTEAEKKLRNSESNLLGATHG